MLIETLRRDQLAARKAGDKQKAALLGTVIAEATKPRPDGSRPDSDDDVAKTLRKFLVAAQETKTLREFLGAQEHARTLDTEREIMLLDSYLPQMLGEDDLRAAVLQTGITLEMRNMKQIKAVLDEKHPGQIDGGLLAKVVKAA